MVSCTCSVANVCFLCHTVPDVPESVYARVYVHVCVCVLLVVRFVVNMFIIMTQFGLCCVYVLFVAANVQQVC